MDYRLMTECLALCNKVYHPDLIKKVAKYKETKIGASHVEHAIKNDYNSQKTYLVFAGSDGLGDWAHNFDAKQVYTNIFGKNVEFHQGFFDQAMTYIAGMVTQNEHYFKYPDIVVTGHSQGAAIAGIVSMFLAKYLEGTHRIRPCLVACPRFTNSAGKKMFNKMFPNTPRIVNGNDAVTHVPLDIDCVGLDYEHVGDFIHIGAERTFPSFLDHKMTNYIESFAEVLRVKTKLINMGITVEKYEDNLKDLDRAKEIDEIVSRSTDRE